MDHYPEVNSDVEDNRVKHTYVVFLFQLKISSIHDQRINPNGERSDINSKIIFLHPSREIVLVRIVVICCAYFV